MGLPGRRQTHPISESPGEISAHARIPAAKGPYRPGRNPMYLGEAVVWLGRALFYGSLAVWAGLAILCAAFAGIARAPRTFRRLPRIPGGSGALAAPPSGALAHPGAASAAPPPKQAGRAG